MRHLFVFVLLAAFVIPHVDFVAAQQECAEDLTGEVITIYHFGDLSGPFAQFTQPVVAGFEDGVAYFNEHGGICGATLETEYADTGASQSVAQTIWDDYSQRDDAHVIFLYITEDAELLRTQASESQIPIMVASGSVEALYGDDANEPGWVFSVSPTAPDQLGAFCDYIAEHWADFGIDGEPTIGHVSFLGAFGESSDTPQARAYCEARGIGYAGAHYFFPGIPDISTQIQRVVEDGANIIYTTTAGNGPVQVAVTVATLELGDQVLLAGINAVLDTSTIVLGGGDVNGMVGQLPYYWWDEQEHPGIQIVTQYWQENRLPEYENPGDAFPTRSIAYLAAWFGVDLYRQLMTEAINEVGFENVTGSTIYDLLTDGESRYPMNGAITIRFDQTRRASDTSRIGSIQFVETDSGIVPQIVAETDFFEIPNLSFSEE